MLVIALVAVVGFAAFSPSSGGQPTTTLEPEATAPDVSARVASAILAIRVSEPETRTASTLTTTTTTVGDVDAQSDTSLQSSAAEESTTTESPTTSLGTTTSSTPATTAPARDTTPPPLRVTSPKDGSTVDDRIVTFSGTTEPGAEVTSGPYEAAVDDDGSWSIQLVLSPGPNGALFTATDDSGNFATVRIVVTYDAPAPTTTSAPATTTTTQPPAATTTTAGSTEPKWSPQWPADAGGKRNVEHWRPLVEKYWPAELVSCALNIIDLESQGDPRAWNSSVGAEGLFQHLSKYWKNRAASAGFKDSNGLYATPYNAEANIAAAWYIAKNASPWHRPWSVNPFYGDCQS